jgi:molybdenum cofactor cytidylyltransferase
MMINSTDKISAILMASGFSRRFGQNKLTFPFRGKPLARHTLELVSSMNCFNGIFFVYADEETAALAGDLPVTLIRNNTPEKGQRESARLGVEAAVPADYYFFFPCDQPFLDTETVRLILAARKPGCIVEPYFKGGEENSSLQGSPALFSAAFRDELLTLKEGEKPRVIKARYPEAVIRVDIKNHLALLDIDCPHTLITIPNATETFREPFAP